MVCGVGVLLFLNPNPQALTSGATVISNAPSVSSDMRWAIRKTSMNMLSVAVLFPLFILDMVDFGLKVDRDLSTFFNSASISFFRLFSLWYVIEYTVPNTNPLSC